MILIPLLFSKVSLRRLKLWPRVMSVEVFYVYNDREFKAVPK